MRINKIKKEDKERKKMRKGHVARRKVAGNFPLESSWIRFGGREGKRRKRKRKKRKERKEKKEEGKWSEKLYLLSKIYRDRAVDFRRSKKQSSSKRRELHVGTRIWGFLKTPRGRGFSHTLVISSLKAI